MGVYQDVRRHTWPQGLCAHIGMCNVAVSRGIHGVYMATRAYMTIGCMEDMHGHWDVEGHMGEYKAYRGYRGIHGHGDIQGCTWP